MKSNYGFSNLLGTVYSRGNLVFTPDGNCLLSPVGNRVSCFDLKESTSFTFSYEHRKNVVRIALSPNEALLLSVDEDGRAILVNFVKRTVLYHFHFGGRVGDLQFSPDGNYFAVAVDKQIHVWKTPSSSGELEFAPFVRHRVYAGHYHEITSITWSKDSRFFLSSSKDLTARIFSTDSIEGFVPTTLSGHRDALIGVFFSANQEIIYTVSRDGALFRWEFDEKWVIASRHYFMRKVKCATFHPASNLLITGFTDGVFALYEMPEFNMVHNLSVSQNAIDFVTVNRSGEWLAMGASKLGQLLVWEWQSETYVLKQQGHYDAINALTFSSDGSKVITAADDGKIKVWDAMSGFSIVTFAEHISGVTAIEFSKRGNVLFSASLDGSVRAWDLVRYRNFRTFTAPSKLQFSSVAVDPSCEVVCAGCLDSFDIHVWSVQTGQLLDRLAGHEGPVSCLAFSPDGSELASGSWDRTTRIWQIFQRKMPTEPLQQQSDVLALAFRPTDNQIAVATLDGMVTIWEYKDGRQVGEIDGKADLLGGRKNSDRRTAMNSTSSKHFNNVCFSADGSMLLGGGTSKYVCIYDVESLLLVRKLTLSQNMSIEGTLDELNSANMTDGGALADIDLSGEHSDLEDRIDTSLPGASRGDLSVRRVRPEIRCKDIQFSPTSQSFAAASTEGLLLYSLDTVTIFDPIELDMDVTPTNTIKYINEREFLKALVMAFRLNEDYLIQRVYQHTPASAIKLVVSNLPETYLLNLLRHLGSASARVEFRLLWIEAVLTRHGPYIQEHAKDYAPEMRGILKGLLDIRNDIVRLSESNLHAVEFLSRNAEAKHQS